MAKQKDIYKEDINKSSNLDKVNNFDSILTERSNNNIPMFKGSRLHQHFKQFVYYLSMKSWFTIVHMDLTHGFNFFYILMGFSIFLGFFTF